MKTEMQPVPFEDVTFEDAFWAPRITTNREATIPHVYRQLVAGGRIANFRLGKHKPKRPHEGSDLFKWIEAAACSLKTYPDARLESRVDRVIDSVAGAQQKDGYLNPYFICVKPDMKWKSLRYYHELYNIGHLAEAGVAYRVATGKRKLLDVACRALDLVDRLFGPGRQRACPGHEEIELALVRVYRATGNERYLRLAETFIDERGTSPNCFAMESRRRGRDPAHESWSLSQIQAHQPVREQKTAEGHTVRMMYLLCGMADVAKENGDTTLLKACRRLWRNITERRMYVTGGIGSDPSLERFTFDYDLPNERAYAETCSSIGMVFFAHRMLQLEGDARYADVMERTLYNGFLSGVALDGVRFFYANPLAMVPAAVPFMRGVPVTCERQAWYDVPCCPPNIARLLAGLGAYVYSTSPGRVFVHLYVGSAVEVDVGGTRLRLRQRTAYPWKEDVILEVNPDVPRTFTLALRVPGWCGEARCHVNGRPVEVARAQRKGYLLLRRRWQQGDVVKLRLAMPVVMIHSHPRVRHNAGRVALQRGPVVYCFEEADNRGDLNALALAPRGWRVVRKKTPFPGVPLIEGPATRIRGSRPGGGLYSDRSAPHRTVRLKAVPYCLWNHRGRGEMLVWIRGPQTGARAK